MISEWIKTSEHLPEEGQEVQVAVLRGSKLFRAILTWGDGWFAGELLNAEGNEYDYEVFRPGKVPYWMPLPELPEEEK